MSDGMPEGDLDLSRLVYNLDSKQYAPILSTIIREKGETAVVEWLNGLFREVGAIRFFTREFTVTEDNLDIKEKEASSVVFFAISFQHLITALAMMKRKTVIHHLLPGLRDLIRTAVDDTISEIAVQRIAQILSTEPSYEGVSELEELLVKKTSLSDESRLGLIIVIVYCLLRMNDTSAAQKYEAEYDELLTKALTAGHDESSPLDSSDDATVLSDLKVSLGKNREAMEVLNKALTCSITLKFDELSAKLLDAKARIHISQGDSIRAVNLLNRTTVLLERVVNGNEKYRDDLLTAYLTLARLHSFDLEPTLAEESLCNAKISLDILERTLLNFSKQLRDPEDFTFYQEDLNFYKERYDRAISFLEEVRSLISSQGSECSRLELNTALFLSSLSPQEIQKRSQQITLIKSMERVQLPESLHDVSNSRNALVDVISDGDADLVLLRSRKLYESIRRYVVQIIGIPESYIYERNTKTSVHLNAKEWYDTIVYYLDDHETDPEYVSLIENALSFESIRPMMNRAAHEPMHTFEVSREHIRALVAESISAVIELHERYEGT
jgi:tetratricopeptide (TPR) repeat protein